ncbi:MAG TPA: redoxin domain-containing protein [Candidatus Avamphibacillus intestinigallinarum]|nr:redoxin domain-containing protein [Candidatus Avamphibacillus intestinigallinarum]
MKKYILIVLVVGLVGYAIYDYINHQDTTDEIVSSEETVTSQDENSGGGVEESDEVGVEKGKMAPDFELETLDGEKKKLSDLRGERVMVNFWATWCPPCRAEIPDLQKFHENEDITILAVNLTETEQDMDKVEEFVDDFGMTFPILLDTETEVADTYKIQPIPSSFMVDSTGRIQFVALGAMHYDMMIAEFNKMK